ncbi:MAG: hypothetical protein KBT31_05055 [Firmicutes bacterium]|nr:hypothetical protein [Candidatus Colimorpha enterica]
MEQVKITRKNGVLKVDIDGELFDPLSFKSFRPTDRNISDFYKAGVRLFSVISTGMKCVIGLPYTLFGDSWVGDGKYDMKPVDKVIDLFIKNAPDGYFALMLQLDTRPWYCEKHGVPYTFTHLSQTLGDPEYRKAACDYMKAVISHVEEKYGDRFYGYFLMCGFTTEWMSQHDDEQSHPIKEKAYREWTGDDKVSIPAHELLDTFDGHAFVSEEVSEYRRFNAELVADSLLYFAREAKELTHYKKLIGAYYGYLFELHGSRLWNTGHLSYEKVFTSPYIDMISSPSSYAYRDPSSVSAFMVAQRTLDSHGKLYYLEYDHITHCTPKSTNGFDNIPGRESAFKTAEETVDSMRRDFMLCHANGTALWWFDMFEGWFYDPVLMESIRQMIEIEKRLSDLDGSTAAEVLVVVSGEALFGVNKKSGLNDRLLGDFRDHLSRLGAPYDVYSACDAPSLDLSRYKLIIIPEMFSLPEGFEDFVRRAKAAGKTIFWFYAPGYVTGGLEKVCELTDLDVKETDGEGLKPCLEAFGEVETMPEAVWKKVGGRLTFYAPTPITSSAPLRKAAEMSGVRLISPGPAEPVYVNRSSGGVYTDKEAVLYLPDGEYEDVFTGERFLSAEGTLRLRPTPLRSKLLVEKRFLE